MSDFPTHRTSLTMPKAADPACVDANLRRIGSTALTLISGLVLLGVLLTPTGLFTMDEAVYLSSAETFATAYEHSLGHGYEGFQLEALAPLLIETEAGPVPQYPGGTTVIGGLFTAIFGLHGLIVMNGLAAIGTLWAARALARQMFGSEAIALIAVAMLIGATFWLEYAFGIWPHAVSILCVTLALGFGIRALDTDGETFRISALAGLAVGGGLLFRLDTALVLVALGPIAILFANRPVMALLGGAFGVLPGLVASAAINMAKFGTLMPFSYGADRGATNLGSHAPTLAVLTIAVLALCALRLPAIARHLTWTRVLLVLAAVVAIAATSPLNGMLLRYGHGIWALVFDARAIIDPRSGVIALDNGTLTFWGLHKKALGQSLPWLGLLCFPLVAPPTAAREIRAFTIAAVAILAWTLPFLMLSWHGGLASNMRYFSPLLPLFSAIAAQAMMTLVCMAGKDAIRYCVRGGAGGAIALAIWVTLHPTGFGGAQQILSTYVFLAVTGTSLVAGFLPRVQTARVALATAAAGVAFSAIFGAGDLGMSQMIRAKFPAVVTESHDGLMEAG